MDPLPDQSGTVAVVTGANSGIGREAARCLAGAGAHVVLAVRDEDKGERARADILAEDPAAELEVRRVDLADLASVRAFAERLVGDGGKVDLLVDNAGVMAPPTRLTTTDGFELQLGTNFLGPFALTLRLLPLLLAVPAPRVVVMSSGLARLGRIDFDDLQWERRRYRPTRAYGQSKLADLLFTQRLAVLAAERRWPLLSVAAHPGWTRTNLQTSGPNLGRARARTPLWDRLFSGVLAQDVGPGTEPLLYAATSPDAVAGGYYGPGGVTGLKGPATLVRPPRAALDGATATRLWETAERLTGVHLADVLPAVS